jgi:transcriptional regulator with XRE-family HTH domain
MEFLKDALRLVRCSRGLTQRQVADALRVKPSVVSAWESGRRHPSVKRLGQLADLLELDLGELDDALELAGSPPVSRRLRPATEVSLDPQLIAQSLLGGNRDLPVEPKEHALRLLLEQLFYLVSRLPGREAGN